MVNDDQSQHEADVQQQLERLQTQVSLSQADIEALQVDSEESSGRAEASEGLVEEDRHRIEILEGRVDVDHELIVQLQADDLVKEELTAHLQLALRTSRLIGAAIGIVMASLKVSEADAFEVLRQASQKANKKLRVLADELVQTGDVTALTDVAKPEGTVPRPS